MPAIGQILKHEQNKSALSIVLYSEGIFYKAYEHSAWLATNLLNRFMVKKKHVKKAGMDIVSIGFPKTSLEKWAAGRKPDKNGDFVTIHIEAEEYEKITDKDFNGWKDSISETSGTTSDKQNSESDILDELRHFPVESKTPIECMMFVSRLKQELAQTLKA